MGTLGSDQQGDSIAFSVPLITGYRSVSFENAVAFMFWCPYVTLPCPICGPDLPYSQ
jgi:hypothetical protein